MKAVVGDISKAGMIAAERMNEQLGDGKNDDGDHSAAPHQQPRWRQKSKYWQKQNF